MVSKTMPYNVLTFGLSDTGLVRKNNEDYWAEMPDLNFFVLADGMGGHRAGEIASKETVNFLLDILSKTIGSTNETLDLSEMNGIIQYAIEYANQALYKLSLTDPDLRGMGTTLCCLLFNSQGLVYAHAGDSRIYRLRDSRLEQLTKDDSLIRQLSEAGKIGNSESGEAMYKGIITKAIGTEKEVDPSVHTTEIQDQDIYLMCTDGLSDMLNLKEIESIINSNPDIQKAGENLVKRAKEKGGFDNITVVLNKVKYTDESEDLPR
jgi:protein phosphatase